MAIETRCQTPDAVYHIHIEQGQITVVIDLPKTVEIRDPVITEANVHNALELALASEWAAGSLPRGV